jgi:hypothetical protein
MHSFFHQVWGIHQLVCTQLYWLGRLVHKLTKGYSWGTGPYRLLFQESQNEKLEAGFKGTPDLKSDSVALMGRRSRKHNFTQEEVRELRRIAVQCRSRRSKLQPQTPDQLLLPAQSPSSTTDLVPEPQALRLAAGGRSYGPGQAPMVNSAGALQSAKLAVAYSS